MHVKALMFRGYIGVILGFYWGYIGLYRGYIGVRVILGLYVKALMFRPARLSARWMEASLEHCREPQWPADKNAPPCHIAKSLPACAKNRSH